MRDFFEPLIIFVTGNVVLLFGLLFWGAIGDAGTQLASDTAAVASNFWGWTWVVTSTRLLVFLIIEGLILFAVAKAFLGLRKR